jgi:hypothetical protein
MTAGHTNSVWKIHSVVKLLTLAFIISANDFIANAIVSDRSVYHYPSFRYLLGTTGVRKSLRHS